MSTNIIRALLAAHLVADGYAPKTVFEDQTFAPTTGVPHRRVTLLLARDGNPTMGDGHKRGAGIYQVSFFGMATKGVGPTSALAELTQKHFDRGLVLEGANPVVRLTVDESPWLASARFDGPWVIVDLSIPYVADVYS